MGDAVMERVAPVPVLPEREPERATWGGPGNAWRATMSNRGPVMDATSAEAGTNHGLLATLGSLFEPRDGMTVEYDEVEQRVWVTKTVGSNRGFDTPSWLKHFFNDDSIKQLLGSVAAQWAGRADQQVRLGIPYRQAQLLPGVSEQPLSASDVTLLAHVDDHTWDAAARLLSGDRSAESEIPSDVIVCGGHATAIEGEVSPSTEGLGNRIAEHGAEVSEVTGSIGVGVTVGGSKSRGDEVKLQRVGEGDTQQWVLTLRTHRASSTAYGASLSFGDLDMGVSHKTRGQTGEAQVLVADVVNDADVTTLFEVVAAAHRGDPDPIGSVEGADTLLRHQEQTVASGESDGFSAVRDGLTVEDAGEQSTTDVLEDGVFSSHGQAQSRYTIGAGFELGPVDLKRDHAIGGDVRWEAKGTRLIVDVGGGSMSEGFGTGIDPTRVKVDDRDIEAITRYATSAQVWAHFCNDPEVSADWEALRDVLLRPEDHMNIEAPDLADSDPKMIQAKNRARGIAIAEFVASRPAATDVLRTAMGRDESVVTPGVLGVLESWPEGSERLHARYDALALQMDDISRGVWGTEAPEATLERLGAESHAVLTEVAKLSAIPARARLEMTGQVLAWRDQLDIAWADPGGAIGERIDASRHRPDSVPSLEVMARRCRTEAAPHLTRLEAMLSRDADPATEDMQSVSELAGILSEWRWVAADLARACRERGLDPVTWQVRTTSKAPRSDLDPDLDTWRKIVDHMIRHDVRIPEAWVKLN